MDSPLPFEAATTRPTELPILLDASLKPRAMTRHRHAPLLPLPCHGELEERPKRLILQTVKLCAGSLFQTAIPTILPANGNLP